MRAKGFLDSIFNEAVIDKISFFFEKLPLNLHTNKNRNFKSIVENRPTASTLHICGPNESTFIKFGSCELLGDCFLQDTLPSSVRDSVRLNRSE